MSPCTCVAQLLISRSVTLSRSDSGPRSFLGLLSLGWFFLAAMVRSPRSSQLAALLEHGRQVVARLLRLLVVELQDVLQRDDQVRDVHLDVIALLEFVGELAALAHVDAELAA